MADVMTLTVAPETIPLTKDADGVIRVGNTRVTLDTVITAFLEGATPEEIVHQYPSLDLTDVYAVITYYLRRRAEVDAYLQDSAARTLSTATGGGGCLSSRAARTGRAGSGRE
jgi:uncharacterized protein (DUF433 family)